jgi:hypothetical protein
MKLRMAALAATAAVMAFATAAQASVTLNVLGSSNPFDAGHATPSDGGAGAVLVTSGLVDGQFLTFLATGATSNVGGSASGTPDGGGAFTMNDRNSIAGGDVPLNSLIGVFLDNSEPTGAPPSKLDYTGGYSFAAFSPGLRQAFFIGDGLTGTGSGSAQHFFVPTGATRLFLGSSDGSGWYDNSGSFSVTVDGPGLAVAGVPEPSAWALMIVGFGGAGFMIRRRARASAPIAA